MYGNTIENTAGVAAGVVGVIYQGMRPPQAAQPQPKTAVAFPLNQLAG